MIKSVKNQLILSVITSLLFIVFTFMNFNNSYQISNLIVNLFILITIVSVFNTGILTQKYIQSKEE
ncbi:hypothetical protein AN964_23230 [Heyndrickxia shackletonii]|uniref:Uncharacterized protein n=1 Tax=Heyndrickxia shackletonii TaxID=157838 RepID=A0A0Q3WSW7_9BACI|nr:hypothetical protein AN964_23230 [Heyndrickxia shackletonii]